MALPETVSDSFTFDGVAVHGQGMIVAWIDVTSIICSVHCMFHVFQRVPPYLPVTHLPTQSQQPYILTQTFISLSLSLSLNLKRDTQYILHTRIIYIDTTFQRWRGASNTQDGGQISRSLVKCCPWAVPTREQTRAAPPRPTLETLMGGWRSSRQWWMSGSDSNRRSSGAQSIGSSRRVLTLGFSIDETPPGSAFHTESPSDPPHPD